MAKVIVANMLIMHDRERIETNTKIDVKKFTEEQLLRLYERGAVRVVDESELAKKEDTSKALKDLLSGTKTPEEAASEAEERKNAELAKAAAKAQSDAEAKQKALDDAKAAAAAKAAAVVKKP